jgi:hypothetical protein
MSIENTVNFLPWNIADAHEDAVFLVKPLRAFARAGLPVYRARQDQDERARLQQLLVMSSP